MTSKADDIDKERQKFFLWPVSVKGGGGGVYANPLTDH